jgi:hypothetical protein
MADLEHARLMLRMAHKDFNALVGMQVNLLFADEIFGFHIQQAVEKALKAWLCTRDGTYPMTHELSRLLIAYFVGEPGRGGGSVLATGSIHHVRGSGAL